jgi:cobalt-zinc-cadmium efflux system membrane fusion protein
LRFLHLLANVPEGYPMTLPQFRNISGLTLALAALVVAAVAFTFFLFGDGSNLGVNGSTDARAQESNLRIKEPTYATSVTLNDKQLNAVEVGAVGDHEFPMQKTAVGSIDFNEDMTVQIFPPYQGKIIDLYPKVGDEVTKGQTLFTIDSPDLLNAEANLISAAGVLDQSTRVLARGQELYKTHAISQAELELDISNQMTAEGNLRTGRDAVHIFGKTDAEIDQIVADRKADNTLVVRSSITGRVTARDGQPGLFVQPGTPPAVYSVADINIMWMLANVAESDVPAFHVGQEISVSLLAFPGRVFHGRIWSMDAMVDPNTHRMLMRSAIDDPDHELRSGMFATFVIRTGDPVSSLAVPVDGVVREGDGTNTVWVTADRRQFTQRIVKIGMQNDGYRQILDGLKPGELVATEGAVFLSNMVLIGQAGG